MTPAYHRAKSGKRLSGGPTPRMRTLFDKSVLLIGLCLRSFLLVMTFLGVSRYPKGGLPNGIKGELPELCFMCQKEPEGLAQLQRLRFL